MTSLLWSEPEGSPTAGVVLQHGFTRSPEQWEGLAAALVRLGYLVVRPRIRSWGLRRSLHDEAFLNETGAVVVGELRSRASGVPIIGIGHSAGAAVVAGWVSPSTGGLDRLILLDPVDRHGRILRLSEESVRPRLQVISAEPSACNRHSQAARHLAGTGLVELGTTWQVIRGTSHADPERIPASLRPGDVAPGDPLIRWVCGRPGSSQAVCDWGITIADTMVRMCQPEPGE